MVAVQGDPDYGPKSNPIPLMMLLSSREGQCNPFAISPVVFGKPRSENQ